MKKLFLGLLALVAVSTTVKAQDEKALTFGAGVTLGLPIGNFADISTFGIGAEFQGEYKVQSNVSVIGTVGFSHFLGKDLGLGTKIKAGVLPILVGARYYPSTSVFFGAQVGYGKFLEDLESGGFAYRPQVGYDGGKFQLALNYNGVSKNGTLSWLGLSGIIKF